MASWRERLAPGAWRHGLMCGLLTLVTAVALWSWWAESHPRHERRLRVLVHEQLDHWFPGQMAPVDGWHGVHRRTPPAASPWPRVLLVHGLDEPGSIWDDLTPALAKAGFEVWEFRYPNDQGIDRSADYLASQWGTVPADRPVVLIGHSMGGLVARDFVTRLRHPVGAPPRVEGPAIAGVILVGTPNQGSEWARLRVWLELRDHFPTGQGRRFSLFAALRDGTGEAKIDLRPGSDFLVALNARTWPVRVPVLVIEGRLLTDGADLSVGLQAVAEEVHSAELSQRLTDWWSDLGEALGDGVVSLDSARLPGGPPPLVFDASHRGLLLRQLPGAGEPPAIAPILSTLALWSMGTGQLALCAD